MSTEMPYRIVVCFDIEAASPEEAYRTLHAKLGPVTTLDFEWESTDEWYGDQGERLSDRKVFAAREAAFKKWEEEA